MLDSTLKVVRIFSECMRDAVDFLRFNSYSPWVEKSKRSFYKIIIEVHAIEKGLSLSAPKLLFGKDKVRFVMSALSRYDITYSQLPAQMSLGALDAYLKFHVEAGVSAPILDEVSKYLADWENRLSRPWTGGVRDYSFATSSTSKLQSLISSRSSIRTLLAEALDPALIMEAISVAQAAPSQCNRQSSQVHIYQDPFLIQKLLAIQGGSKGFSESVGNLFVVSSEISAWGGPGQRNQTYVDGALFSMCLLFACRALGWGACPLNLAIDHKTEKEIRRLGSIPASERLIMMIAFGKPQDADTKVAFSPRRPVAEIATLHLGIGDFLNRRNTQSVVPPAQAPTQSHIPSVDRIMP